MNVDEFILKLEKFNDVLPQVRDQLIIDAVFSAAAIAKARVIRSRETHDGAIFGIYSPAYLKKRIKSGKGNDPKINFSFTGKMWQSTQPEITSSTENEVRIRIHPLDPGREKIMGYHDDTYGEIIQLSENEMDLIVDHFTESVQGLLNNTF